jgi:hypothetical protein
MAFWRCPKCENKTKVQKKPLTMSVKSAKINVLVNLNLTIKYCPYCDLIIAKEKNLLFSLGSNLKQEIKSSDVFIFGTLDRKDWINYKNGKINDDKYFDLIYPFKDVYTFKIRPAGWYPIDKKVKNERIL